jgi:hypothetical protein
MVLKPKRVFFKRPIGFEFVVIVIEFAVMAMMQGIAHRMIGKAVSFRLVYVRPFAHTALAIRL